MFSKPKPDLRPEEPRSGALAAEPAAVATLPERPQPAPVATAPKPKPAASVLSSDLTILGNVRSSGDIQVEGTVEGDIRAHTLIVGEGATVKGEVIAEEVVVHGRVVGRLRGLKVRLTASARCEGDIVHKTIAIESGAHFEGSVQRQDDPLGKGKEGPVRGAVHAAELATA
jgi:cytoskeletal protein CcmA (bactofilin family)